MAVKVRKINWRLVLPIAGLIVGAFIVLGVNRAVFVTSTDEYCQSCHIHTGADEAWTKSPHYSNESGVRVGCADCHLPPHGNFRHFRTKVRTGLHDLYAYHFKDHESFDWERKQQLEYAVHIVFNESCVECHKNLFPKGLTDDGGKAHLYYEMNAEKLELHCINCHLDAGHDLPGFTHQKMTGIPVSDDSPREVFTTPTSVTSFESFTEQIPFTSVSFNMIAVNGGEFQMGSPESEPLRDADEGPLRTVKVSPFFMGEVEVTWDEYWTFYSQTMSEGRLDPETVYETNASNTDAISGPTPPFGNPGQGWGSGDRPAITMSHYAALTYCQWLSKQTGKTYRLPTEAEWEYACRAGTTTPYFFEGDPKRFSSEGLRNRIFGADTARISSFTVYATNSGGKTHEPSVTIANPFGLKNMAGNVLEYCSDWYSADAYAQTESRVSDPTGPESGTEHVIRGGSYLSGAADLRSAARASTQSDAWLKTDCQQPKSIWWYSDMKGIGFRVVCEPDSLSGS
jgi:formylglycine-generating enzyme required for sulfatase activity/nitrate/TMAO reductase-like tetraheme cytochrome c subunit